MQTLQQATASPIPSFYKKAIECGLTPVRLDTIELHKRSEVIKHPPSVWYRFHTIIISAALFWFITGFSYALNSSNTRGFTIGTCLLWFMCCCSFIAVAFLEMSKFRP